MRRVWSSLLFAAFRLSSSPCSALTFSQQLYPFYRISYPNPTIASSKLGIYTIGTIRYSSSTTMARSTSRAAAQERGTRRNTRLLSSSTPREDDIKKASVANAAERKRKKPSKETTTSEETKSNDVRLLNLEIENADRKTLQELAKQYGIKANQKSDVLRTELLAIVSDKPKEESSHQLSEETVKSAQSPTPPVKVETPTKAEESLETPAKKKRKSPKKVSTPIEKREPPDGWLEIYQLVEELRADRSAPVDTDGSEALPERQHGPKTYRFQVLMALMLSSQTKDAVVGESMRRLQQHGLTVENIHHHTSHEKLDELIRKVGFHNNKTKYIKQVVEILLEKYDGDIPPTAEEMMELPGVGPKMAFIVENVAWDKTTGIGVDTHMHRMFNQLKWVNSKNPEQTRMQLEAWLPKEYWNSVNLLWVGFGQEVQQYKAKTLRKALDSSRPKDALKLVNRLGLDYRKEGEKLGLQEEIADALKK